MDSGGVFIMKKYSTKATNKILISFAVKSIVSTIISILCFTFLSGEIIYKLDLDLNKISIASFIIVGLSSAIISIISVYSIKNSGAIFGLLSEIPLIFYMLINAIFNNSGWLYFGIKLLIVVLIGVLFGIIVCEKSKKIRV